MYILEVSVPACRCFGCFGLTWASGISLNRGQGLHTGWCGIAAWWCCCLLASSARLWQHPGFALSWSVVGSLFLFACFHAALAEINTLFEFWPKGLQGEQVEVQDFVSNEEIVNPSLAQSCCLVFAEVLLTTTSSRGGRERRDGNGPAPCIIWRLRHAAFKPHFSVAAFEALHQLIRGTFCLCFMMSFLFFVFYLLIFSYFCFSCWVLPLVAIVTSMDEWL